jgi:hypothetical protein
VLEGDVVTHKDVWQVFGLFVLFHKSSFGHLNPWLNRTIYR